MYESHKTGHINAKVRQIEQFNYSLCVFKDIRGTLAQTQSYLYNSINYYKLKSNRWLSKIFFIHIGNSNNRDTVYEFRI